MTVDCKQSFLWSLLPDLMAQLGKVLVAPHANSINKCRFCMLWDTSCKRPGWLRMNITGMRRLCFKLDWGAFAGHCFKCGQWGHFIAECQSHVESSFESPLGEERRQEDGRTVGLSVGDVVMAEGISIGVDKVVQEPRHELVGEIGTSVGNISGPGETSKEWHQVQRKIKGKGIMVHKEKFPTHDTIHGAPLGNFKGRDGLKKSPWRKHIQSYRLPTELKFDSSGKVVRPPNNSVFQSGGLKQQPSIAHVEDVVHVNPYVALEQAVSSFVSVIARKEQGFK